MVEAFIRERGVTVCPPRTVDWTHRATANGHESPESFLFREAVEPRTPEQRLATAKILLILHDLADATRRGESVNKRAANRIYAERWFFGPSDFELWCETAGLDAETVRQSARRVAETGIPKEKAISTGRSKNAQYQLEWQRQRRQKQRSLQ